MLKSTITRWFAALVFATPGFVTEQDFADDVRRGGYTGEVIVASDLTSLTFGS